MRKFIAAIFLSIVGFSFSGGNVIADVTITCPLDQARRMITDDLPDGWWTTPIVNRLSETKISKIGGRPALLCIYGSSGSVQYYAPKGHTCKAMSRGFRCMAVAARPDIFSTGKIDIRQTFTFDLDRGRVGVDNADVWFQAETRDLLYLVPRKGATMSVGDRSNRGYAGCSTARYSSNRVSLRDIPVGSYICARTNEGRISQFRINKVSHGTPKTLSIGYTTWK
jgi:hypothetical protein